MCQAIELTCHAHATDAVAIEYERLLSEYFSSSQAIVDWEKGEAYYIEAALGYVKARASKALIEYLDCISS